MIPYRSVPNVTVGPLTVRTFGLCLAAAVVVGAAGLHRELHARGVRTDPAGLVAGAVTAGIVGARLSYVVTNISRFADEPVSALAVWDGGLHFLGGVAAGGIVVATWATRRRSEVSPSVLTAGIAAGLPAALAVGRVGCVAVGEHLGSPSRSPLAVRYIGGDLVEGALRVGATVTYPALYEAAAFALLAVGVGVWRRRVPDPVVFAAGVAACWAVVRFAADFMRVADRRFLGLTAAQAVAVVCVAAAAIAIASRRQVRDVLH